MRKAASSHRTAQRDGHSSAGDMFFDLISSYGPRGFSDAFAMVCLVAMILYFVSHIPLLMYHHNFGLVATFN